MAWNKKQIEQHKKAAFLICKIKDEILQKIKKEKYLTEYDIQQYILKSFRFYNLKTDKYKPIVAFRQNTSFVHYYPDKKSKKLSPGSLILLDIWARLNVKGAPFADITWMAYYGNKIPKIIDKVFKIMLNARDLAIKYIKSSIKKDIPAGKEIHNITSSYLAKYGYGENFLHGTGHSLGFISDHGSGVNINKHGKGKISIQVGYTIEPGIYLDGKFGVRSEIDFYINSKKEVAITTDVQKKITLIKK